MDALAARLSAQAKIILADAQKNLAALRVAKKDAIAAHLVRAKRKVAASGNLTALLVVSVQAVSNLTLGLILN